MAPQALPNAERRLLIDDVRVLAALAHPVRVALVNHLLELGPATATECAVEADVSPSACSYHFRELARFGLVERDDPTDDGRERRWRARYTGFGFDPATVQSTPAGQVAASALADIGVAHSAELASAYMRVAPSLHPAWQEAATFHTYGITVTPEELIQLTQAIDALIRPFLTPTRAERPDGAMPVHITLHAFQRTEQ
jgi:predicted transcriptional regulator